jgi:hypothetical protein
MRVQGLDGKSYVLKTAGKAVGKNDKRKRSGPHLRARALLAKLFPFDVRLEEVVLPGTGGLRADFLLASLKLVVEVQGRQHEEFVPYFHRHLAGYGEARRRDCDKRRWCEINRFVYLEWCEGEEANWGQTLGLV